MWCLRGYYFKMAPGTVKKAIVLRMNRQIDRQTALFIYRMIMNVYE